MTPRTTINFFRSRTGGFVLFLVLLIIGYLLVNGFKPPSANLLTKQVSKSTNKTERKSQVVETVTRDRTPFHPPKEAPAAATPAPTPEKKNAPELPPISLYSESS